MNGAEKFVRNYDPPCDYYTDSSLNPDAENDWRISVNRSQRCVSQCLRETRLRVGMCAKPNEIRGSLLSLQSEQRFRELRRTRARTMPIVPPWRETERAPRRANYTKKAQTIGHFLYMKKPPEGGSLIVSIFMAESEGFEPPKEKVRYRSYSPSTNQRTENFAFL